MLKREYKNLFENQEKHWWHQGMRKINSSLIKRYLVGKKNLKVLDVGCGSGANLVSLSAFGKVIGVDKSEEALKYACQKGEVRKTDISSLPFPARSFDLVVCLDVLYHRWVKDEQQAIKEMKRVLKKNGFLLLREPAFNWLHSSHDLVDLTERRFTSRQLRALTTDSGLKTLQFSYLNFFLFPLVLVKRLPEILGFRKKQIKSDLTVVPGWLNFIFSKILCSEAFFLKFFNFPFGSSVLCLAQKSENK